MSVLGILILPLLALIAPANASTYSGPMLNESEFQLFVSPAAPNLPADSGTYHAVVQLQTAEDGMPFEAPANFEVRIVSSDPSVVSIPQERIIFAAGEAMIKVELRSTEKAGIASVTALAEGVESHTTSISTLRMDSFEPTRLAIYAAPSSFIPDSKFVGMIYIQLLNSQSLPAISKIDTPVDLSSSDSTVGKIFPYVVIPAGSSGVLVEFTPQKKIGQTVLKASALGLAPAELQVDVRGPVAESIMIEFAPDILPAINYNDAMMTVQLVDKDDKPVKAATNTRITLRSSDTSIAEVPQYVDILAGNSYASSFVKAKGTVGSVTITASATGYETGLNTIEAIPMSTASMDEAKVLKVFNVPSILPPDNSEHQSIVVAFQDEQGMPYRQSNYIYSRIALSTSNTLVGDITSTSFIGKETYAIGKFKTKYAVGDTVLTASVQGYQPGQFELVVDGSGPAAVSLTQIPGIIEAKGVSSNSLVVSLLGHDGEPVAAQDDTTVYLSSSDTDVARVSASILVPAGESYAVTEVQSTQKAGQVIVSGASDGLASGSTTYRTVGFSGTISEYHLGLYSVSKLPADGRQYDVIVVQLQDQAGLPVLAKTDTEVSLSAASFAGGRIQEKIVIPAGSNLATAMFMTSVLEDSEFKVTASGQGFQSVELELETTSQPLTIVRSNVFPSRANFEDEIYIGVDVYSGAIPIVDATITITGTNAQETVVMTDVNGHAEGRYIPTLPGTNSITVVANKPGYEQEILTSRVILDQSVKFTVGATTQGNKEISSQVKISGPGTTKTQTAKPGAPITYDNAKWGSYTLNAQEQIKTSNAIYDFAGWSDGSTDNPRTISVVDDTEIKAIYQAQYLLQIVDPNGIAKGGGYYAEGTSAAISISEATIGGLLVDKTFGGWSGDIVSSMASTTVTMDGPKTASVIWSDNYLKVILIVAAAGAGGFFYYWKIFKPKKELEEKQRAPDLDWYKA